MNDIPVSTIYEQPLTNPPFTPDNTLIDDTVALVDDPGALVGGQTTIIEDMRVSVQPDTPKTIIQRYS